MYCHISFTHCASLHARVVHYNSLAHFRCFALVGSSFLPLIGGFDDENIIHVEGDVNPVRDMEIIHDELRLKVVNADRLTTFSTL